MYVEDRVKDGVFGAMMQVALVNDGPVTIEMDVPANSHVAEREEVEKKKAEGKPPVKTPEEIEAIKAAKKAKREEGKKNALKFKAAKGEGDEKPSEGDGKKVVDVAVPAEESKY